MPTHMHMHMPKHMHTRMPKHMHIRMCMPIHMYMRMHLVPASRSFAGFTRASLACCPPGGCVTMHAVRCTSTAIRSLTQPRT